MKRFLSMALALALVLTSLMVPAYADGATGEASAVTTVAVDITSIKDGDTFAAGSNVKLAANAEGLENVKNIDFYANGAKLPGTIMGNTGAITWYDLTEGVYDITTKVTYNYDNATAWGTETVKVVVLPADQSKIKVIWPKDGNVSIWESGSTQEYEYVEDFAMYGAQALKIVPHHGKSVNVTFAKAEQEYPFDWFQAAVVVYAPQEIEGLTISGSQRGYRVESNRYMSGDLKVYQGYNRFVTGYNWGSAEYLKQISIDFSGAPENNTKPIYLVGIYGMKESFCGTNGIVPVATPEIADGAKAVCNEVGTYRINFSSPIFPDDTKAPAKVTYDVAGTATEVQGVTYTYGTDYVDLHLPPLELETTYTVSIPANTILSYYSAKWKTETADDNAYVAASTFTFSTKETDCDNATPVVKMSYPAPGVTCLADTAFAAKLVSGSSAIDSIKFYKDGAAIEGTVTAGTEGEYWFQPDAAVLTAGVASEITVKALNADGGELATASATYTGAATPSYFVKGIYNGAVVVKTHETSRTITVSDAANATKTDGAATNVAKVEFYDVPAEGEKILLDTAVAAPYSYDLAFSETGAKTIEVRVYDNFGGVHSHISNYTVVGGVKSLSSIDLDFENTTIEAVTTKLINNNDYNFDLSIEEFNGSNALKLAGTAASGWQYVAFNRPDPTTGYKVHYIEFDYATSGSYSSSVLTRTSAQSGTETNLIETNRNIYTDLKSGSSFGKDVVHKVALVIDCNGTEKAIATVNIGGKEWKRLDMTKDNLTQFVLHIGANATGYTHIDNFKHTVYETAPEYAVKGIYEDATMVKEEEPTRTITVVDKANADVVSTAATKISKVEFYKDDVLAATDEDGAPYTYALANDSYGAHKLEVKVTDTFNQEHSFVYNYNVVEGSKNTTYSIEEDFADGTDAELNSVFNSVSGYHRLSAVANGTGGYAVKVKDTNEKSSQNSAFKAAPSATGRKVHYYEFDLLTAGYGPSFNVNGTALFDVYTNVTTNVRENGYFTNNLPVRMKVVFDCDQTTSVATISFKGKNDAGFSEWKRVEFATPENLNFQVSLPQNYEITLDNFKYSVYNYPERFGKGDFDMNVVMGTPASSYIPATVTTKFTNTTDEAVTVRNFFVVYSGDGRLANVYVGTHDNFKEGGDKLERTYEPGAFNEEQTYRVNVSKEWGDDAYAKIFSFVKTEEGIDFAPIKDYE